MRFLSILLLVASAMALIGGSSGACSYWCRRIVTTGEFEYYCCDSGINTPPPPPANGTSLVDISSSSTKFMIKHKLYNKFLGPYWDIPEAPYNYLYPIKTAISDPDAFMWRIELQEGLRGYIRNGKSGKILNPDPDVRPPVYTLLREIDQDAGDYKSYFILDQATNHIVAHEGKYLQPFFSVFDGGLDEYFVCFEPDHYGPGYKEFLFIDPNNQTQEVLPYGKPVITVDWVELVSFIDPQADTTWEKEVYIGKSTEESTTNKNEFAWEVSATAKVWFIEASGSISDKTTIENSAKQSWNDHTKITQKINVRQGVTIVRWRRVFAGSQLGHVAVFESPHYSDTNSTDVKPNQNTPTYTMI